MSERLVGIVTASDDFGVSRWQAVTGDGSAAGVAGLRPGIPFRPSLVMPPFREPPSSREAPSEVSLHVAAEWRNRGIGSRLLAAVREQAAGRLLAADVTEGTPEEALYRRHGFQPAGLRRHDLLTYCDVHQAWVSELVDDEHPGYRLADWSGAILDAPAIADVLDDPNRLGHAVQVAADADGDLAAYATVVVGPPWQRRALQYGPAVLAAHRGHGLGRWVSAALIQRLREIHPHVDEIQTATADDDLGLIALRGQLGFRFLRRTRRYAAPGALTGTGAAGSVTRVGHASRFGPDP
ncbi:MAG: GNAT family N-acetyltransferase [Hamadaea sp.]|uniref:GNAT family N-acetyltransferase n=1 Tax=Hamadaea sp. TaxID=2024425 RepID=UPI00183E0928|nr:GNAT family N-acetyltransferase [Hamadaea sp.]NUT22000.1 GNAT family N-acetyltransferase [Hamadaea sp.]